jgi:hypothetical protein
VFSVDNSKAFIASNAGEIYVIDLDAALEPLGDPHVYASLGGTMLDALVIDACDNLYVARYSDRSFLRVSPEGRITTFFEASGDKYGHGAEFGSGLGGWREDALYLPQPYDDDTVRELVIGVPSAEAVRAPWTAP